MSRQTRIGVLGASGYTGASWCGSLLRHPRVEIVLLTADRRAGQEMARRLSAVLALRAAASSCRSRVSTGRRPDSISRSARCRMARRRR